MEITAQIIEIFLLGLIGGAVPGPMLTAVFTEVLNSGFKKSLRVVLRALFAETIVATAILLVIYSLNIPESYFYVISIVGSVYLIWLAIKVWKIDKIDGENKEVFIFSKIFLLTLLNGGFWIFWITVCVPRAFVLQEQILGGVIIFLVAMELGWLVMTTSLGFAFSRFRPLLLKKNLVATVFKIFALLLVFFAVKAVVQSCLFFSN
ncbi:MAG TPA: LysE family transporter [Patescibacteria group bacterium]|nr:LysE family transporter [Patescibacteria group bacterium]